MAIVFVTTDALKWGTGLGTPLTAGQADNNIWELLQRIVALEADPPDVQGITNIELSDGALVITMSDATTFGPFPLPIASIKFVGEWLNNGIYAANDIVTVADVGVFLVLKDHVAPASPASFDPGATVGGEPLYRQVFGIPKIISQPLATNYIGPLAGDEQIITQILIQQSLILPADLTDSGSYLDDLPTDDLAITIWKNDVQIGTINHVAGEHDGSFDFDADVSLNSGDRLVFRAPLAIDATAANWSATLVASLV